MFDGPMSQQTRRLSDGPSAGSDDRAGKVGSVSATSKFGFRTRNTVAVGDVDGRAFDILLRSVSAFSKSPKIFLFDETG
jgi:hypothetical protein